MARSRQSEAAVTRYIDRVIRDGTPLGIRGRGKIYGDFHVIVYLSVSNSTAKVLAFDCGKGSNLLPNLAMDMLLIGSKVEMHEIFRKPFSVRDIKRMRKLINFYELLNQL